MTLLKNRVFELDGDGDWIILKWISLVKMLMNIEILVISQSIHITVVD